MADEKTPPTEDETTVDEATAETAALPAAEEPDVVVEEPTEKIAYAPVAADAPSADVRRRLDSRSVIATAVAIAALAASFGVGYAVGDHDGDGPRGMRVERFSAGAPGMPGRPGMRGDERGGDYDRGFDGPGSFDSDGGGRSDERGFRSWRSGSVVMGTVTKLDGDELTIDPMGDEDAQTITLSDDVRVIKRGADGREDGSRSDLDEGALVVTRGGSHDSDDDDVDTIVILQTP